MILKHNFAGTTANAFSIGKQGPTIYQGNTDPGGGVGQNGDLYIKHGSIPSLWMHRNNGWTNLTVTTHQSETVTTNTHTVAATATFVAVTAPSGGATITLPTGIDGKEITIKDFAGTADTRPLIIQGTGGDTIDGAATATIAIPWGAIKFLFSNSRWNMV